MKLTTKLAASVGAIALLMGSPAFADGHTEAKTEDAAGEAGKPKGPALWKVADEDTTIYLFGTVHALPKDLEWYDEDISNALAEADTLVTEIRMDPESEARMEAVAMEKSALPEGTTLRSLLDADQTAAYEAAMTKLGVSAPAFDGFEPWMAGLTLTMLPLLKQGYSPDSGVEKVLMGKAADKPMDALETPEFQIG
ncbi:MAG: TraB/GumN family protein, partial [Erythrobacter sp.]